MLRDVALIHLIVDAGLVSVLLECLSSRLCFQQSHVFQHAPAPASHKPGRIVAVCVQLQWSSCQNFLVPCLHVAMNDSSWLSVALSNHRRKAEQPGG